MTDLRRLREVKISKFDGFLDFSSELIDRGT